MCTFLTFPMCSTCITFPVLILNLFLLLWSFFRVCDLYNTKMYSKIWLVSGILYSLRWVYLSNIPSSCVPCLYECMVYMPSCDTAVRAPRSDMAVFWPLYNWLVCVKWSSQDWWQWLAGPSGKCCALSLVWVMFRAYDISGVSSVATNGWFLGYI
jgi:hypothetical protein